ncbi:MAG: FAD-binding oxidoreductase, partial [Rhodococcus sp. (in: high G+C Gram-positive bacteria)]
VQYHRLRNDLAVIRLVGDVIPFAAGQSLEVTIPQNARLTRRYSPALPPSLDGKLEFHVRAVPAGWVSGSIVNETRPGDVWKLTDPKGTLAVDDSGRDVVMIASGTGLAPMRSLILDLAHRATTPPPVTLYVGGRSPRDLYAADLLWILASELPWLTVVPVVDQLKDPWAPDRWNDTIRAEAAEVPIFGPEHCWEGSLADVMSVQEPFRDHQVLVCGSPGMEAATISALIGNGTPAAAIRR